jgi:bifunctional NMN adenylyltransferase/nudix hydrolase
MQKEVYDHAVVIGRFQPFHNGHKELLEAAFEIAKNVIVIVGSARSAPNVKNPFPFHIRKELIEGCFPEYLPLPDGQPGHHSTPWMGKLKVVGIRDYFYSDSVWISNVQALTDRYIQDGDSVALLGNYKDTSSYYLRMFPHWEFVPVSRGKLDATTIRRRLFGVDYHVGHDERAMISPGDEQRIDRFLEQRVPGPVLEYLRAFRATKEFVRLSEEHRAIEAYKASWKNAPYPPQFVTADAVVTCAGHVLVVRRGFNPGKGLYALPGGFVRDTETVRDGALRELKEETRIRVERIILDSSIVDSRVFDNPNRSLRGRTITHAFHVKLKDGKLPEVSHGDDAAGSKWMPLMDVARCEAEFFEDHAHIINYFVSKG